MTMPRNSSFLPALGVGFIGFSLYIGLIVSNFQSVAGSAIVRGNFLLHNSGVIITCLVLYILARRQLYNRKYLSIFIATAAIFCILTPFFVREGMGVPSQWQPIAVLACRAIFAAFGFLLLYSSVPAGREGLFLALALATYDLLWTLLSPLLGLISPQAPSAHMLYLYYICCWMIGVAGLLFATSILTDRGELPQQRSERDRPKLRLFGLLYMSAVGVFLLIGIMLEVPVVVGLLLDVSQPKFSLHLQPADALYIVLLLLFPLAGRFLDQRPDKAVIICIAALIAVVILELVRIDNKLLSYLLDIVRLLFFVIAHATVAKLFRGRIVQILLLIVVYLLLPMQFIGVAMRDLPLITPIIASMVIISLLFARRELIATPDLWSAPMPMADDKLLSFAAAHELTARERDVLSCLIHEDNREAIAQSLQLSVRTVRYHISNLQKKLSMPNERSIVDYYNRWQLK
jgi:DNA-binding CsgD family transcriptional regulator